jgi:DNA-binding NarL/FixJ family response regulator
VDTRSSVLILCCNRLLRESVARILGKKADFHVIPPPVSPPNVKSEEAGSKADVVVLDSLQLLSEVPIVKPENHNKRLNKCVLVSMEDDQKTFLTAVRLGVLGYVLQDASALEVVNAIRSVAHGEAVCPPKYVRILYDYFLARTASAPNSHVRLHLGLTKREQQLIPLIERGLTNKEIANQLNLSEQTVKNHVHRILRKVGVEDRLGVVEAVQTQAMGI